jgi:hypothetical protein
MGQLDLFGAQPQLGDAPLVCRVPTEEEKRAFAEEFPEFVAPMPEIERCYQCLAIEGQPHADWCDDAGAVVPKGRPQCLERCSCGQRCTEDAGDHQGRPHGHGMHFWNDEDKARRAAPSTRTAESVECPSCHSLPGDRCRNYRGKGCAPHRQRIEAAKDAR